MNHPARQLVFASRPSPLALHQTRTVMRTLEDACPGLTCDEKIISTEGDKILNRPLPEIGGKGLFTLELENALLSGEVHCAVHSLKDLPVESTSGLVVGCIPARADVRDVLISHQGYTLETLPPGSVVGTSSLRRSAQVLSARPDLMLKSLRGNVDTRLQKAQNGNYAAILLAGAGLIRLGLLEQITQWLPLHLILPAPGQGALAVQCRADDASTLELLAGLEEECTRKAVTAERSFLEGLGGGCSAPVAAYASVVEPASGMISLKGRVLSLDGRKVINVSGEGTQPEQLGHHLASQALQLGAAEILSMVKLT